MLISMITPIYENIEMTKEHITTLLRATDVDFELILIDDGSQSQIKDQLLSFVNLQYIMKTYPHFKEYKVVHYGINRGFAHAVNVGIVLAEGDYICIWNNDMFPISGYLQPLIDKLTGDYGMITSTLIEPRVMSYKEFFSDKPLLLYEDEVIDFAKSGPWLFKREVFDKVGLFDERFKYGTYEDADIMIRMAQAGMKFAQAKDSYVYHLVSVTLRSVVIPRAGFDPFYTNRALFCEKWPEVDHTDISGYCKLIYTTVKAKEKYKKFGSEIYYHTEGRENDIKRSDREIRGDRHGTY